MDTTLPTSAEPDERSYADDPSQTASADLDQLAIEIAELIDTVAQPALLSPMAFIDDFIHSEVKRSTMEETQKALFTSKTKIYVEYAFPPADWAAPYNKVIPRKTTSFELHEIVTDFFRHSLKRAIHVRILWPDAFPADLRHLFDTVNLQARYENEVKHYFNSPHVKDLSMLLMQNDLDSTVRRYVKENPAAAMALRETAAAYLKGRIEPQRVQFNMTTKVKLERAVFLPVPKDHADNKIQGLLVFLGNEKQHKSVYEVPRDITPLRELIDGDAGLRKQILERIPLYYRLHPNKGGKPRSLMFSVHIDRPLWVPPIAFESSPDILGDLFDLSYKRLLSDIDTLVSTDGERLTDELLEVGGQLLSALALGATLPFSVAMIPARIATAFLLGLASAATNAVRGSLEDLPDVAADLYRTAFLGALSEVIAPLVQKMAGKALSALSRARLARKLKAITTGRHRPSTAMPYLIDVLAQSKNSAKMLALESKLTTGFKNGPQAAQLWVDKRGRFLQQFIEPHKITVYKGFVFRGDMRNPSVIFKKGFKLRTPAADLQKDIHQATGVRGGFGGGRNALDPDGKGISTSAFYNKDNVGAYTYGGAKGGNTYLVDARKLDGYHLYANDYAARHPGGPPLKLSPVEINYATDIPPSMIVGAYDKNGVFIANLKGIRRTARINQIRIEQDLTQRTFIRGAVKDTVQTETTLGIAATLNLFG